MHQGMMTTSSAQGSNPSSTSGVNSGGNGAYPTDEEILGIDTGEGAGAHPGEQGGASPAADSGVAGDAEMLRPDRAGAQHDNAKDQAQGSQAARSAADEAAQAALPEWLKPLVADAKAGPALQSLWEHHQAYREIFPTVGEARAIKELFPGGAEDAKQLLARTEQANRIDEAYFSGDANVQGRLAQYLLRDNPRAFLAMLRQSAQSLAAHDPRAFQELAEDVLARGGGKDGPARMAVPPETRLDPQQAELQRQREELARERGEIERERQEFRAAQYASFQESANEAVVSQVRQGIEQTIAGALPASVSDGARKRIVEDIYNEINTTLQNDAALTRQVAGILRQWRFDDATRQQVINLIFGRAKTLVPAVAKRIVSDWTSSVLSANREKAAKHQAAASRVDIVGGGAPETVGKRSLTPRDIDYSKTSDDQILNM